MGVDDVEAHLKRPLTAEVVQHLPEQLCAILEGVDGQRIGAVQQGHRRYQARQPEAVVTVQVADENVVQPHEFEFHASHSQLCPLATVNHHQVVAHV